MTRFDHLPERAVAILDEFTAEPAATIFPLSCSLVTMYSVLRDACNECGIEYGRESIDGVTFHSTRHSFTTRLVEVTDLATAQSFTGHANKQMIAYYSHASDGSPKAAMERMYGSDRRRTLRLILTDLKSGVIELIEAIESIEKLLN